MNRTLFALTAFACSVLISARSSAVDETNTKRFREITATTCWIRMQDPSIAPTKLEFGNHADAMLEIDSISIANEGREMPESAIWEEIHTVAKKFVDENGPDHKLHVRFYHSDYKTTKALEKQLHTDAKRTLADLQIFVVMVDEHVRNDQLLWRTYLANRKSLPKNVHQQIVPR